MASSEPSPVHVRLPGVGSRLEFRDASGRQFQVVRRKDGGVEVYSAGRPVAELDDATARAVGAFISGHYLARPELADRLGDVLGGLSLDWVTVAANWSAAGKTIEQLAVRRSTGVTIVAILRGPIPIVAPNPDTRIVAGDDLVVACRDQDLEGFVRYMSDGRR